MRKNAGRRKGEQYEIPININSKKRIPKTNINNRKENSKESKTKSTNKKNRHKSKHTEE